MSQTAKRAKARKKNQNPGGFTPGASKPRAAAPAPARRDVDYSDSPTTPPAHVLPATPAAPAMIPPPVDGQGGYGAGETLTVPEGHVAVLLPYDTSRMNEHLSGRIDLGSMKMTECRGLKAVVTGLDHSNARTQADHAPVLRKTTATCWIFRQIGKVVERDLGLESA